MRIVICDSNKEHAEILEEMVRRWAEQEKERVIVRCYRSAEQFLFSMRAEECYDIVFVDIQMGKIDGFQLAHIIREEDRTITIVFTTGTMDYALKGYEVSAFRYLLKPLQENEVFSTLTGVHQLMEERMSDAVIVTRGDESRRVFKNAIYYIEVDNHHIILHLKDETIRFKAKLKEFEVQFKEPQFCKCHRSYIVNMQYVGKISREGVNIDRKETLPISRARWDSLNHCYLAYYMK